MLHTKGLWPEEPFDQRHASVKEQIEQLKTHNSPWEKEYMTALLDNQVTQE